MSNSVQQFLSLLGGFEAVDLSHVVEEKMPTFPSHTKFFLNKWVSPGDPAFLNVMIMGDHTGTHFDTPSHFVLDESNPVRKTCEEIDHMALVGHALKLSFGPFEADNGLVTADEIRAWERENLAIQADDIVIFDYGWAPKWKLVDEGNEFMENWPGLSEDAVDYLIEKKIRVAGTDCASIDAADGAGFVFPGHFRLLGSGILLLENLMNLDQLPAEFVFMALPLKIKGAGGSPIRAVGLKPKA